MHEYIVDPGRALAVEKSVAVRVGFIRAELVKGDRVRVTVQIAPAVVVKHIMDNPMVLLVPDRREAVYVGDEGLVEVGTHNGY
jgi:hypothetical protein